MTVLVDRGGVDQPYIEVISVAGKDRVYVGNNDLNAAGGMTATVDRSLDAAPPAPAGFLRNVSKRVALAGMIRPPSAPPFTRSARFMRRSFAGQAVLAFRFPA